MQETQKVQYLVVDTTGFIRNTALQEIGTNIITAEDVVNEVTSKRQLRRLVVLPYDLSVQNPDSESIKFVTEFSKKTGDYASLSATDIKVIALTYQLEKEKVGLNHLKNEPIMSSIVDTKTEKVKNLYIPVAGFYIPQKKKNINKESTENSKKEGSSKCLESNNRKEENKSGAYFSKSSNDHEAANETTGVDQLQIEDLSTKFEKLNCESSEFIVQDSNNIEHNVDHILVPVNDESKDNEQNIDDDHEEYDDNDDDDNGWITPKNISIVKKELDSQYLEEKPVVVACLTMDFAMQNILKQIGLNVVALDGRMIKQMRTFLLRCYACFKTTSIMTKVFCPSCGNKTLKKVAVTLNEEGKQQIHINFQKPISKRGKRFPLPMPKGGKHANNPILCEDQPLPDQKPSRLARTKIDALEDDYIAGYSPFIMRDINSRSAMLGIRPGGAVKYWMKRNPNECRRKKK